MNGNKFPFYLRFPRVFPRVDFFNRDLYTFLVFGTIEIFSLLEISSVFNNIGSLRVCLPSEHILCISVALCYGVNTEYIMLETRTLYICVITIYTWIEHTRCFDEEYLFMIYKIWSPDTSELYQEFISFLKVLK